MSVAGEQQRVKRPSRDEIVASCTERLDNAFLIVLG